MSALLANPERAKYEALWAKHPEYRHTAPGESLADLFVQMARIEPRHSVIDFGCGTGRGVLRIAQRTGAQVTAMDFVPWSLDAQVQDYIHAPGSASNLRFEQRDLTEPLQLSRPADFGYCTDVMEHIPPESVEAVMANVVTSARRVFLCISTVPDRMGALIGEDLHLTVRSAQWWRELLTETLQCRVMWERTLDNAVLFYVSAFATVDEFESRGKLNVGEDVVESNVHRNLGLGLTEIAPHAAQDTEVILLCGGPSLNDFEQEIIAQSRAGVPLVTVNGTYNWCIERHIAPGLQIMVDARAFNRRFIEPVLPECKYAVSSQCDPDLVAALPRDRTILWHGAGDEMLAVLRDYDESHGIAREYYPVPGGSTIALRALPMLAMLGFRRISVYGLDSCYRGRDHHAYEQRENDDEPLMEVSVDGRVFACAPWMALQAQQFQEITRYILAPAGVELHVHGDGLIATIIAALAAKES